MYILDNCILPLDVQFEHNGIQYPANWLRHSSAEQREQLGIIEKVEQARPDDRYYWVTENGDGTYTSTAKDLAVLKQTFVAQIKDTANKLLAPTDWQVIRKIERNVDIDTDVASFRAAVIDKCADLESKINKCKSVNTLQKISYDWPSL